MLIWALEKEQKREWMGSACRVSFLVCEDEARGIAHHEVQAGNAIRLVDGICHVLKTHTTGYRCQNCQANTCQQQHPKIPRGCHEEERRSARKERRRQGRQKIGKSEKLNYVMRSFSKVLEEERHENVLETSIDAFPSSPSPPSIDFFFAGWCR